MNSHASQSRNRAAPFALLAIQDGDNWHREDRAAPDQLGRQPAAHYPYRQSGPAVAIRNVTLLLILCATIISWIENYAQEGASEKRPDELDRLADAWVDQLEKRDSCNMVMSVLRELFTIKLTTSQRVTKPWTSTPCHGSTRCGA